MTGKKKEWPEEQKFAAVAAFVGEGTVEGASRLTGIPANTIYAWRHRNPTWWQMACDKAWAEIDDEDLAIMHKIWRLSTQELADRAEKGEKKVNPKTGEVERVPVSSNVLNVVAGTSFDKLTIARGKPTSITSKVDSSARERIEELRALVADSPNRVPHEDERGEDKIH